MITGGLWMLPFSRRKLFEDFANKNDFDPLIADNWFLNSKNFKELKVCGKYFNNK